MYAENVSLCDAEGDSYTILLRAFSQPAVEEIVVTALLVSVLLVYLSWLLWNRYHEKKKNPALSCPLPPGGMGWPLVGESLHFAVKGARFFVERFAKHGRIYKTHLLGSPTIRVAGADYIWSLMSKEPHMLTMKIPTSTRYLFGKQSVAVTTGQEHSGLKRKLLASVSPLRLGDYLPCIQEHMRSHILSWCERGSTILGYKVCEELMCDIMLEVVLGWRKENDVHGAVRAAFVTANHNLFSFPVKIPGGGFYKANKAKKIITDFVKKRLSSEGDKNHVCMLDVFLASHREEQGLTDEQIIDNAVMFLLAGTGTTSSALSTTLLMLGKHPEVLDALRTDLDEKGLLSTDPALDLSYDVIQSLEFCHSISKEILRLHPPVGGLFRQAEKTLDVGGFQIPKGWTVMYSVRDTHSSTTVFEDGDLFLPQRWMNKSLEEKLRMSDSCNYMPFGNGPRVCLGKPLALMEMAVFQVEIARLANWRLHNPETDMIYLPVTKASDDMPVTFSRRTVTSKHDTAKQIESNCTSTASSTAAEQKLTSVVFQISRDTLSGFIQDKNIQTASQPLHVMNCARV